jgi:hypothetical protein
MDRETFDEYIRRFNPENATAFDELDHRLWERVLRRNGRQISIEPSSAHGRAITRRRRRSDADDDASFGQG